MPFCSVLDASIHFALPFNATIVVRVLVHTYHICTSTSNHYSVPIYYSLAVLPFLNHRKAEPARTTKLPRKLTISVANLLIQVLPL